jgi:hypothetical protein
MDLRNKLIGLACEIVQVAQPLSRFGFLPPSPKPGKGEGSAVFHGGERNGSLGLAVFQSIGIPSHLSLSPFEFSGVYLTT